MKGIEKVNNIPLTHLVGGRAGAEPGLWTSFQMLKVTRDAHWMLWVQSFCF